MNQGQIVLLSSLLLAGTAQAATPKYVFYFIGDGMGAACPHAVGLMGDEISGGTHQPRPAG